MYNRANWCQAVYICIAPLGDVQWLKETAQSFKLWIFNIYSKCFKLAVQQFFENLVNNSIYQNPSLILVVPSWDYSSLIIRLPLQGSSHSNSSVLLIEEDAIPSCFFAAFSEFMSLRRSLGSKGPSMCAAQTK